MYGKIDEKIDIYSYGVVLLELITGKEAIQTNQNSHGSLVLWVITNNNNFYCKLLNAMNKKKKHRSIKFMFVSFTYRQDLYSVAAKEIN